MTKNLMWSKLKCRFFIAVIFVQFFLIQSISAATISLQPTKSNVNLGNLFTVNVVANTQDKFINNAEAIINFPPELIEVFSISTQSSIFNLWVEQPVYSNLHGSISFNGGVPNPGFKGSAGQIFSIVFRAKKPGTASIFFLTAALRENDGLGTDILTARNNSEVIIEPEKINNAPVTNIAIVEPQAQSGVLGLSVNSPTHPDQNSWYSSQDVVVTWKNPPNTIAIRTALSRRQNVLPNIVVKSNTERRELTDVDDGISYFHVRYQSNLGWSEVSTYQLKIDTIAPSNLILSPRLSEDGKVSLDFDAFDELSGIQGFEIKFDDNESVKISDPNTKTYTTVLLPGKHEIVLSATDKAGNRTEKKIFYDVPGAGAPKLNFFTKSIVVGNSIYAIGEVIYPDVSLIVTLKSAYGVISNYDVRSDKFGKFAFISEPLDIEGEYEFWVSVVNADGTRGAATSRSKVVVEKKSLLNKLTSGSYGFTKTEQSLLILIVLAVLGWYNYLTLKLKFNNHLKKGKNSYDVLNSMIAPRKKNKKKDSLY